MENFESPVKLFFDRLARRQETARNIVPAFEYLANKAVPVPGMIQCADRLKLELVFEKIRRRWLINESVKYIDRNVFADLKFPKRNGIEGK